MSECKQTKIHWCLFGAVMSLGYVSALKLSRVLTYRVAKIPQANQTLSILGVL